MTLSAEQEARLARLKNRATLYEAAIVRSDGQKRLLAYCGRKSVRGLVDAVCSDDRLKPTRWFMGLVDGEGMVKRNGRLEADNGSRIEFTGRTQRDAIMDGNELTYIKE